MYQAHIYVFSVEKLISSLHFVQEYRDLRALCPWYKPSTCHAESVKEKSPGQIWLLNNFLVLVILTHEEKKKVLRHPENSLFGVSKLDAPTNMHVSGC